LGHAEDTMISRIVNLDTFAVARAIIALQDVPADQRRLIPKIAWKRFIDLIRTGK